MEKKILAIVLTVVLIFALSACGVSASSSSTTTVSTSVTDSDGNTQTNTVTNEVGISAGPDGVQTTNETTTDSTTTEAAGSMADLYAPVEEWYDIFAEGSEGQTEYGLDVYFAVDDPNDTSYAMLLFCDPDGGRFVRDGELSWDEEEECFVLYDADMDQSVSFTLTDGDEETVVMTFADGDSAVMTYVDQDTIINDIHEILSASVSSAPAAEEEAA